MKKIVYALLLITITCQLTGCDWQSRKETKEYKATQIMCDIDNSINMDEEADEEELRMSLYAFSDLFSNNAYKKLGDLTESYAAIRQFIGKFFEAFDQQTVTREMDILKATYRYTTHEGKEGYIYYVANMGTGDDTRGLQYLHVADSMEIIEAKEEQEYGIFVNGEDVVPYQGCEEIQYRSDDTSYEYAVDFGAGDSGELAKEVADGLIQCIKENNHERMKKMFSNSIWRYDMKLDEEIHDFFEEFEGVEIQSYQAKANSERSSTSTSYLKDSEGSTNPTGGHGMCWIGITIQMKTNVGEKELQLQVYSEYEPNPARIGISQVYEQKNEEEISWIGFRLS